MRLLWQIEFLLHATGIAVIDLVQYADSKVVDQTMAKRRMIVPNKQRVIKWIRNSVKLEDSGSDHTPDNSESGAPNVCIGDSLRGKKKDPEHLPPQTTWERFGERLQAIPRALGSSEAAFGLRVAFATMSIGITAYLEASQSFFLKQRLVW